MVRRVSLGLNLLYTSEILATLTGMTSKRKPKGGFFQRPVEGEIDWSSTPQAARKRKKVQITLSDEAREKLAELAREKGQGMQSWIVEQLILGLSADFSSAGRLVDLVSAAIEREMSSDARRKQVSAFAYANMALTDEWKDCPLSELKQLQRQCEALSQLMPSRR